jgi:hypothetical protein
LRISHTVPAQPTIRRLRRQRRYRVAFGGTSPGFVVNSDTSITTYSPARSAGTLTS